MLVLSRRVGETIFIGDGPDIITITVTEIDRGKVRLGITAPETVPIHRSELAERIAAGVPKPRVVES